MSNLSKQSNALKEVSIQAIKIIVFSIISLIIMVIFIALLAFFSSLLAVFVRALDNSFNDFVNTFVSEFWDTFSISVQIEEIIGIFLYSMIPKNEFFNNLI